jgi:hypothetical protein
MEGLLIGLTLRKAPLPLARCCCVQRTSSPALQAIQDGGRDGPQ